jgi:uncharacterized protein (TIGR02246 family)
MPAQNPEECEELFAQNLNSGDIARLLTLYEPHASHIAPDGVVALSSEAIRLVLDQFATMQPKLTVSLKKLIGAGDDLAVLYDDWTLDARAPDGGPIEMKGKSVHIVRRQQDGSWLFAVTSVTNAPWA